MKTRKLILLITLLTITLLGFMTINSFASNKDTIKMEDGSKFKGNEIEISVDLVEEITPYFEEEIPIIEAPVYEEDINNENSSNNTSYTDDTSDFPVIDWDYINNNTNNSESNNNSNKDNTDVKIDDKNGNVSFNNEGWFDDQFIEFKPPTVNNYPSHSNNNKYYPPIDDFYSENSTGNSYDYNYPNYENEKPLSGKTVHYVLDINKRYPTYRDTGIRVSDDNLISYEEAQDVLNQIVVMKKNKLIEDIDKTLGLVDGKIIIIKKSESINVNTLTSQLNGTSSIVKVLDTRMGGQFNLADYVEFNKNIKIKVNDKDLDITAQPIVENSKVLLPIRDIAEALNAKVIWDNPKQEVTIIKGEKKLTFTKDSSVAISNGVKYSLSNPSRVENNRMLTLSQFLVNELGGTIEWDAKELTLIITIKD